MALFIFKYALPALLAYTLFVGIAGRFYPFKKPDLLEERPPWMLGIWTGGCVFLVLMVGLHMAYGLPVETGRALAMPAALALGALLACGLGVYFLYKDKINAAISELEWQAKNREEVEIDWRSKVGQLDDIINPDNLILAELTNQYSYQELAEELVQERNLREETERHLRITRKALATAAQATRLNEISANTHSAANSQGNSRSSKSINQHETDRIEQLELSIAGLRRELVSAKQDIRNHVAARAKALSTANKSVAFARQSIEIRAQLEIELKSAKAALISRQSTIGSLVSKLERERRLTDEELLALRNMPAMNDDTRSNDSSEAANPQRVIQTKNISGI